MTGNMTSILGLGFDKLSLIMS